MKRAVILLLSIGIAVILLYARFGDRGAPSLAETPSGKIAGAWANGAADDSAQETDVPASGSREAEAGEPGILQRLCEPGTILAGLPGGSVGMKNIPESVGAFEAGLAGLTARLAVSNEPEHLLTAALISDTPEESLVLVKRALRTMPFDANLLHKAIGFCREARDQSACPLTTWEWRLLETDAQNSESWMLVATNRYDRGDRAGALEALRQAASASDTRRFVPETIALIKRSLAAASDLPDHLQFVDALGIAAAIKPDDRGLTLCERAFGDNEWLDACLRYGQLAEQRGRLLLTRATGLAIQRGALEAMGRPDALPDIAARTSALRKLDISDSERWRARMLVLQAEPVVQRTYLEAWAQEGETRADALVDAHLERRLAEGARINCTDW